MQCVWYLSRFLSAFCIYLENFGTYKGLSEIDDWKRRSSHRGCSVRKGNFAKFTGKHLCPSLLFFFKAGESFVNLVSYCKLASYDGRANRDRYRDSWRLTELVKKRTFVNIKNPNQGILKKKPPSTKKDLA